jgi:hypothetical protein
MSNKEFLESINTIRICNKDHNHFTNKCCVCLQNKEDGEMVPIWIDRRAGFDNRQYPEMDYACKECLIVNGHKSEALK